MDWLVHDTGTLPFYCSPPLSQSESRYLLTPTLIRLMTSTPPTVVISLLFLTSKDREPRDVFLSTLVLWDFRELAVDPTLLFSSSRMAPMANSTR